MKPLSSAIAAALILFSAQGVAEQTTHMQGESRFLHPLNHYNS